MIRLLAALLLLTPLAAAAQAPPSPIILGYIRGHNHLIQPGEVAATKLTRIHYAFLYPEHGTVSAAWPNDDANLRTLVALKRINPRLEVLASIGGGANSSGFSALSLTPASRQTFVASCMALIAAYHLDGIDIDWEFPSSPADKTNYTALFHDLRDAFDLSERTTHHHLLLSTATNGKPFFLRATNLGEASRYLDTIALMGYDDYGSNSVTTGNASPLFTHPGDPTAYSDDRYIRSYIAAGVPAGKIVLGVPFYGYGWHNVAATDHGLFQPVVKGSIFERKYTELAHSELLPGSGYTRYWDTASAVPFLYNETTHSFITYEDPESIARKAAFVREHGLGGMMFWEYSGDPGNILLDAIDKDLQLSDPRTP